MNLTQKPTLWQELKNALSGTDSDYTKIGMRRAIFLLAIPMILELIMESTFAIVDVYFVGKLGASAVATVGLTETYLFILYAIAMGLSMAVTAVVARRIGEKNNEKANISAVQTLIIALIISLPIALIGIFYSTELLQFMGADAWTIQHGTPYTRWMIGGNAIILLLFTINAIFRGAGNAVLSMRVLWVANGINILLDPLLIFGWGPIPAFGIEGAAIATNIGRGVGVLMQLWILFKGHSSIKILKRHLQVDIKIMTAILKTSLGGIGQMLITMTTWIFIMRILANIGSEAVAGATIALRIMMFTLMPAWGFSNAAATLVGQNLGAGNPDRAEESIWKTGWYTMIFLVLVSLIYFLFNQQLMGFFSTDARVIEIGSSWLQILSYSYCVYGWWMVSIQAFNGSGDTTTPIYINLIFFWGIQLPLAYYLALHQNWAHLGVFWAIFISETAVGLFTLWLFTRGKWKKTKV